MTSVFSQLIEEVTAHAQSDSLEDVREICADGTYFPNNLCIKTTKRSCSLAIKLSVGEQKGRGSAKFDDNSDNHDDDDDDNEEDDDDDAHNYDEKSNDFKNEK